MDILWGYEAIVLAPPGYNKSCVLLILISLSLSLSLSFSFIRDLLQDEELDPNCPGEQELTALHIAMYVHELAV